MTVRERRVERGKALGRDLRLAAVREFRLTRTPSGLTKEEVARAAGISGPQYGRIERGLSPDVSVERIAVIATVLGLEPSLRFHPKGDPIRDAGFAALLERLHARCHASLAWRTEVPFPIAGDRRAWDALIRGTGPAPIGTWRVGVEAETRPNDVQALDRKLALRERDGEADWLLLLLLDSRHNRSLLAAGGAVLRRRCPLDGRRALELLAAGAPLGANALVLL
jgi:transcriptional regulator with XRE-family HTH domain